MPQWAGKWKGGRFYLDGDGHKVFFIERRRRTIKLKVRDEDLALGELSRFLQDPVAYVAALEKPAAPVIEVGVFVTPDRIRRYLESIRGTVSDHRTAKSKQLADWANVRLDGRPLDLRTVDRATLRRALAVFSGGHRGRTETLNAFARFLVKQDELATWRPLENTIEPKSTRAKRAAYSIEQLAKTYEKLTHPPTRDAFLIKTATGLHYTEVQQLAGAPVYRGPLPDTGPGIRELGDAHEICGVLQVVHRKKHKRERRHRVSIGAATLAAALRLRETGVPHRSVIYDALDPLVASNLRHTFTTLAGEVGRLVTYTNAGVDRARISQALGHRDARTTADHYDKLQVPHMIALPLPFL